MKKILFTSLLTLGLFATGDIAFAVSQTFDFSVPGDYLESNPNFSNISAGLAKLTLGSFTTNDIVGDTGSSNGATTADFNNDGNIDIYVANSGGQQNKIWLGDGLGGFTASDIVGDIDAAIGATTGDFNNDGNADIYVAVSGGFTAQNKLWLGDGLGGFTSSDITNDVGFSNGAVSADFNNDGNADIFLADNNVSKVHIGNGLGSFTTTNIGAGNGARYVISADFNNDGNADVYITKTVIGQQNKLFLGDGLGGFTANDITGDLGAPSSSATTADFNNDGNADIYVANTGQNKLWLGDGLGGFTANDIAGDTGTSSGTTAADFNGDGNADIYVVNSSGQQNKLWLGDGLGGFTANDIVGDLGFSQGVTSADFNNDGGVDIYVASTSNQQNKIYLNGYSTTAPSVEPNSPFVFTTPIVSFSETLGSNNQGGVAYQVSLDAGATWQYYDGAAWVTTTQTDGTEANTAVELNTNLSTLAASGSLTWRAYLISNGSEEVEIDQVTVSDSAIATSSSSNSGGSKIKYVCKDENASNYEKFGRHKASKCEYESGIQLNINEDIPVEPKCTITYTRLIKKGVRGEDVKQVQTCMNSLGYSTGFVDGIYGPLTYAGVTAFQRAQGLKYVDGIVGPETSSSLNQLSQKIEM